MPDATQTDKARNSSYREVERVRDPDGVIAIITERIKTGQMSFAITKEFDQDGTTKTSPYLARRHIEAVRRLCNDLEERLDALEDQARSKRRAKDEE